MCQVPAWANAPDQDLIAACKAGDLAKVDAALAKGASPDATDKDGNAALEKAVFWPEITKRLLEKGAKPDGGAYPALITAGNVYAVETMKLLLDAGSAAPTRSS